MSRRDPNIIGKAAKRLGTSVGPVVSKVCRIIYSSQLNKDKYGELEKQAKLLGTVRTEVWQRFGSINGVGANHRKIRDEWIKVRDFSPLPEKAWKETLRVALDDIKLYEEAAKKKVKLAIFERTQDKTEQRRLFSLLKSNEWPSDPYLSRMMRKYKKHGRTQVENQIVLESGVYGQFKGKDGNTWLKVPSFTRRKPVTVPLNSNVELKGCLRLILKDNVVQVHQTIEKTSGKPCGDLVVGIDKGYTEAFADSEGNFYGETLGKILTEDTEEINMRGKARNKLAQIAKKKPKKARRIKKYNLGRKKLERKLQRKKKLIRNIAFHAVHKIVDKASEIRAEDLTQTIRQNEIKGKGFNRRMSAWAKGSLAEALESVTRARCSRLQLVNCAYTSQMDSNTGLLHGKRVGDKFYHANGDVSHAGTNAAVNIKHRGDDADITRRISYRTVRKILLDRATAIGGVSGQSVRDRPSRTLVARKSLDINRERITREL